MHTKKIFFFSVRHMLMLSFFLLILLPYLLTTTFYTLSMRQQLENEASTALSADNAILLRSINALLSETERVAYLHLIDQDIARILQTRHTTYDLAFREDERIMTNAIKHATSLNSNILAVTFYTMDQSTYQMSHIPTMKLDAHTDWIQTMQANNLRVFAAAVSPYTSSTQTVTVLPVIYLLSNSLGTQNIGFVRVDYNLKSLWDSALQQCSSNAYYALFQEDTLLWDSGPLFSGGGTVLADSGMLKDGVRRVRSISDTYALCETSNDISRLRVIAYNRLELIRTPVMRSIYLYLLILGVLLASGLIFSWFISRQIGNSIKELAFAMDNAEHGQNQLLPVSSNALVESELDQLRSSYNSMIDRLARSAKSEYEARVQQKNIAMRVLESQINPHFLYNALNLISSLAQLTHQDSIRSVAISLASILRYSIKSGSIVSLEEELNETTHYINIMKMRFPDRIVVHTHVDASLLPCRIPKLLLQPLLENACKYATDTAALMVVLEISVRGEMDDLVVCVADNGPGIPGEKLAEILEKLASYSVNEASTDDGVRSLGLVNVHARVRAHFGEPYGITIDSVAQGCSVSIRLPKLTKDTNPA